MHFNRNIIGLNQLFLYVYPVIYAFLFRTVVFCFIISFLFVCKVLFIIIRSIIFGLWMLYNKPGCRLWFQRNLQVFQAQSEFWRLTCFLWLFIRNNLIHVKLATGSQCVWMNGQRAACVREMEEINLKALIHCRPAATFTLTQTDSYLHGSLFFLCSWSCGSNGSSSSNEIENFMGWFLRGEKDVHRR